MRLLAWMMSVAMALGIAGAVFVMLVIVGFSQGLPDVTQLQNYDPPVVSRVHAGDGRLMAEFASERRIFVPIDRIPQRVIDAFVSAEDKNFYEHSGIDITGLARAVVTNLQKVGSGARMQGASTITQQVAKNFLVGNESSYRRKIREALVSFRIEHAYTKDEILELYLNEIFLGQRAYGVAAASLAYFNKTLDELTLAEAAYLAVLPKAPNNYHPERNHDEAITRRNYVLGRMLEDGKITKPEYDIAMAEPLQMRPRSIDEFYRGGDYFTEEVRRELVQRYGEDRVLNGGLLVRASVDPRLQDIATTALRGGLTRYDRRHGWRGPVTHYNRGDDFLARLKTQPIPPGGEMWQLSVVTAVGTQVAEIALKDGGRGTISFDELKWARSWLPGQRLGPEVKKPSDVLAVGDVVLVEKIGGEKSYGLRQVPAVQGALVAMDANTGRVLAMVGGYSPRMSVFNRATQAMRQPGSSFKPFVYLTGLENGFTPSTLILDAPISLPQGPGLPEWRPGNFEDSYLGPTTMRVGVEKSRNVMTVRLAQAVGIDKIAQTVETLGVLDRMQRNYSMVLGAGETTVMREVTGYASIVNGGRKVTPTLLDSVQDKSGRIIYRHDDRACNGCNNVLWQAGAVAPPLPDNRPIVVDPRSAYQMVHILEGVIERGTGSRVKGLPWPLAGKTGTTNDYKDNWFVGFSSDMVVGLYIGFDQPQNMGGHSETGGMNAAPVFKEFMAGALEGTPPIPFRVPPGLRFVRVNPSTGHLAEADDPKAIWEAFKPGTEPQDGDSGQMLDPALDASLENLPSVIRMPDANAQPVTQPQAASSAAPGDAPAGIPDYLPSQRAVESAQPATNADDPGLGGIY